MLFAKTPYINTSLLNLNASQNSSSFLVKSQLKLVTSPDLSFFNVFVRDDIFTSLIVPILDLEFIVVYSNFSDNSVIASNLSGKLFYYNPFCPRKASVSLLIFFFLLHKQQNVMANIIIKSAAAMTVINRIAWHFSHEAQPPFLQQYMHFISSIPQISPL